MLTAVASRGLSEGLSGRAMLGRIRAAGGAIRTQDFYRAVRAAKAFEGSKAVSGGASLTSSIASHMFEGGTGGIVTKYNSVVTAVYSQEVDGEVVNLTKDIFIRSDTPISVSEVVNRANLVWEDLSSEEDPRYPHGSLASLEYIGTAGS